MLIRPSLFSDEFTIDDFINSYQFAKDAAIETSNLHFVPITELDEFLMNEKNSFLPKQGISVCN